MLANNNATPRKTVTMLCQIVGTEQYIKVNVLKSFSKPTEPFVVQVDHDSEGEYTWLRNSSVGVVTAHDSSWFKAQAFKGLEYKGKIYMQLEPVVEQVPTHAELAKAKSVVL